MRNKVVMDGVRRRGVAGARQLRAPLLFSLAMVAIAAISSGGSAALAASPSGASSAHVLFFSGKLDASQVVGGSASTAKGKAVVRIDTVAQTITTDLSWSGLSGPADRSHIHSGDPGTPTDDKFFHEVLSPEARTVPCGWDGATFAECVPTTGSSHDVLNMSDYIPDPGACPDMQCIVDTAVPNGFFIDMHTQLYPGGEIRGQLTVVPRRPDARVRLGKSGSYLGNNVYNTTARHQSVAGAAPLGGSVAYQVSIQNDAKAFRDRFTVSVTGVVAPGYHVTYLAGGADITSGVVAGTYTTGAVAAGGNTLVTVIVHVGHGAAVGSRSDLMVTVTSFSDPGVSDTVGITARRH